jgi:hypothetical protein
MANIGWLRRSTATDTRWAAQATVFYLPARLLVCSQSLEAGYQVVALHVEPQVHETSKPVLDDLCLKSGAVYIKAGDGSKTDCFGMSFASKEKEEVFAVHSTSFG